MFNVSGAKAHPSSYYSLLWYGQGVLSAATLERTVENSSGSICAKDYFEDFCAVGVAFTYKTGIGQMCTKVLRRTTRSLAERSSAGRGPY